MAMPGEPPIEAVFEHLSISYLQKFMDYKVQTQEALASFRREYLYLSPEERRSRKAGIEQSYQNMLVTARAVSDRLQIQLDRKLAVSDARTKAEYQQKKAAIASKYKDNPEKTRRKVESLRNTTWFDKFANRLVYVESALLPFILLTIQNSGTDVFEIFMGSIRTNSLRYRQGLVEVDITRQEFEKLAAGGGIEFGGGE